MTAIALTLIALVLAADQGSAATETRSLQRKFHEIDRDISAALKREAAANDLVERGAAVRQLGALFMELDRDERTPTSPALQEYRAKVRARLVTVQKKLRQNIARAERKAGRSAPAAVDLVEIVADRDQQELAAQLAAQVSLASYASGGPGQFFEAAGGAMGGGAVIGDHGEELVELIQRTISPSVWAENGGPCTIMYYRPLMCLVVRATGDTHGNVGGLLDGLRRAGP